MNQERNTKSWPPVAMSRHQRHYVMFRLISN